jgi:hypothetical protein
MKNVIYKTFATVIASILIAPSLIAQNGDNYSINILNKNCNQIKKNGIKQSIEYTLLPTTKEGKLIIDTLIDRIYSYNNLGYLIAYFDYDPYKKILISDGNYSYDSLNRIVEIDSYSNDKLMNKIQFKYNGNYLVSSTRISNSDSIFETFSYDKYLNMTKCTVKSLSISFVIENIYSYDSLGLIVSMDHLVNNAPQFSKKFEYNSKGILIKTFQNNFIKKNSEEIIYSYDYNSKKQKVIDFGVQDKDLTWFQDSTFYYNSNGDLSRIFINDYDDLIEIEYKYDNKWDLESIVYYQNSAIIEGKVYSYLFFK